MNEVKINLPKEVNFIIETIIQAGYEAYAVGGCIRDRLIDLEPDDYDITTSASPYTIKELFKRTVDTGIKHGTVTVMIKDTGYEVTTYRIDGKYEDSRHPKEVTFTQSLKEDLLRRDFTINAMAYNDKDGLVDYFGGMEDLKRGIIRCVGNPVERFTEDALRIMRAARFSAQLGYSIEEETLRAMKELSYTIKNISMERIQVELVKLILSDPSKLVLAYETGITKVFFKEFDAAMECEQNHPHHCYSVGMHTIKAMENVRKDRILRLAMLFHDLGKPACKTTDENGINHFKGHPEKSKELAIAVLKRLKFDNYTIRTVAALTLYHDMKMSLTHKGVRHMINKVGEDIFPMILEVREADMHAQSLYKRQEKEEELAQIRDLYEEILQNRDCVSVKDLLITGNDLFEIGCEKGPLMGQVIDDLLVKVLDDPTLNNKETLLKLAKEIIHEKQNC